MLSPVRLSSVCLSVCRLSVTLVHPTQAVVIFGNFSIAFGTLAIVDAHRKFYRDLPRGTPPPGELNPIRVANYSDFGPIEGYISRKRCKIRGKLVLITNRKSHMSFRLVAKSVTLNDLNGVVAVILRYFSEIGSIWGALCKNGGRYSKTFCDRKVGRSFCFLSIYYLRCYDVGNPSMGGD